MSSLLELNYTQHFHTLPTLFYSQVTPQPIKNPRVILTSDACADLLGIDPKSLSSEDALKLLSGQGVLSNWQPLAMKYTGHQFGHYNPELGDGRGVLLAQIKTDNGTLYDLHLKGAGQTPYSRQGDGRAVLRSSIREFLCSEALYALGVPTTRALSLIDSDTTVYRETAETASMIIRVAKSHIRFGHFEFCSFSDRHNELKLLCDHVIGQHYPHLLEQPDDNRYLNFYDITLDKTAKLMAHWQSIGFNHGVMNTDNMSIIADTFDFGPFAFLDDYDPNFICNHSDHQGRYAFKQQPNIANWNLAVLAQAMLPLTNKDALVTALDSFPARFSHFFFKLMGEKLGLSDSENSDHQPIIERTLNMMRHCRLDYTYFFRRLSGIGNSESFEQIRSLALDVSEFDEWFTEYKHALHNDQQDINNTDRIKRMNAVNPKFILRNYLAQNAIEAAQKGDYSVLNTLHHVLKNPFEEQPEHELLAALPPEWGKKIEISCSS